MSITITAPQGPVACDISLPASKSISNRVLIIQALCGQPLSLTNISDADDSLRLIQALESPEPIIDCGAGGTTLRFLLALFAAKGGDYRFTGTAELMNRPVEPLLNALRQLGATITVEQPQNSNPVIHLISSGLAGPGPVHIPAGISSQFISALMLIGPAVSNGIEIHLEGELLSKPYVLMTARLMEHFGISVSLDEHRIRIEPGHYLPNAYTVEPDWSSASYWYEIAALRPESRIRLTGLHLHSFQGDAAIASVMTRLGVDTEDDAEGLVIRSQVRSSAEKLIQELSGCPDTAPALIATCAGLGVTADFPGLKNFRLKESDRAAAFQRELYNFSVQTDFCGGSKFKIYGGRTIRPSSRMIKTYNDHRVAMAMAPLSLVTGPVMLEDESVVKKSYPGFFNDLKRAGFLLS